MIVGYLRGQNHEKQAEEINNYAKENNIEITKFYLDANGPGDQISSRLGYKKMLKEHEEWDTVIVQSLEILHTEIRNMFDFLSFLLACNKNIISVQENVKGREFLVGVYSLKKIFETNKGEYISKNMISHAHLDTWIGYPPYGYKIMQLSEGVRVLAIREAEGMVVKLIFMERARGSSYKTIAEILNSKGIPATQRGKRWTHLKIMRILDNKVYWGYREVYNETGEKIWIPHNYPCIVDENLGKQVYAVRAWRKERKK
jgi:DNA invertase Pin-like site-specific DNA recombinase